MEQEQFHHPNNTGGVKYCQVETKANEGEKIDPNLSPKPSLAHTGPSRGEHCLTLWVSVGRGEGSHVPTVMSPACELVFLWFKETHRRQGKVSVESDFKDSRLGPSICVLLQLEPQQEKRLFYYIKSIRKAIGETNWQLLMKRDMESREENSH